MKSIVLLLIAFTKGHLLPELEQVEMVAKVQDQRKTYNILNLDGHGLNAFMNTYLLDKIEKYAYEYATLKKYKIPKSDNSDGGKKVAIKDIFDMTSGISTNTLLIAGLSLKSPQTSKNDQDVRFTAEQLTHFQKMQYNMFKSYYPVDAKDTFTFFLLMVLVLVISFVLGNIWFDHGNFKKSFKMVDKLIRDDIEALETRKSKRLRQVGQKAFKNIGQIAGNIKSRIEGKIPTQDKKIIDINTNDQNMSMLEIQQLKLLTINSNLESELQKDQDTNDNKDTIYINDEAHVKKDLEAKWKKRDQMQAKIDKTQKQVNNLKNQEQKLKEDNDDPNLDSSFQKFEDKKQDKYDKILEKIDEKELEINNLKEELKAHKNQYLFDIKDESIQLVYTDGQNKVVGNQRIEKLRKMQNFDRVSIPYNGTRIDNNLLTYIIHHKKDQILDGCLKFIHNGDKIREMYNKSKKGAPVYDFTKIEDSRKTMFERDDKFRTVENKLHHLKNAKRELFRSKMHYMSSRPKKWFLILAGFFLGANFLDTFLTFVFQTNGMNNATEKQMKLFIEDIFGPKTSIQNDVLTDDILMPGFEFQQREPYFFTKWISQQPQYKAKYEDYYVYNVVRATFSYPGVFIGKKAFIDPYKFINTAAYHAYIYTKYVKKQTKSIRMLSISPTSFGVDYRNQITLLQRMKAKLMKKGNIKDRRYMEFNSITNAGYGESYIVDKLLKKAMGSNYQFIQVQHNRLDVKKLKKKNYLRDIDESLQKIKVGGESDTERDIRMAGEELYKLHEREIKAFVDVIMDDRYKHTIAKNDVSHKKKLLQLNDDDYNNYNLIV